MTNFLDRFREKSEGERKAIAIIGAALITLVISIVWITTLHTGGNEQVQEAVESADTPFASVWRSFKSAFSDLNEQYNALQELATSTASTSPDTTQGEQFTPSTEGENMLE